MGSSEDWGWDLERGQLGSGGHVNCGGVSVVGTFGSQYGGILAIDLVFCLLNVSLLLLAPRGPCHLISPLLTL